MSSRRGGASLLRTRVRRRRRRRAVHRRSSRIVARLAVLTDSLVFDWTRTQLGAVPDGDVAREITRRVSETMALVNDLYAHELGIAEADLASVGSPTQAFAVASGTRIRFKNVGPEFA